MKDELGRKIMKEFIALRAKSNRHKNICHKTRTQF